MWGHFKNGVMEACNEVCWKKSERRSKGDTWWWNDEVKEAVSRKHDANKLMCWNSTDDKKMGYECKENKARKAVSKAMRGKTEEAFTELRHYPNGMLKLVNGLKTASKEYEVGRCMRGCDGKLCFC